MLEIEAWPKLTEPVLVYAFSGWVDAGLAGSTAVAFLGAHVESAREFARYDLSDVIDLQQTRPLAFGGPSDRRSLIWPTVRFAAGRAGRDVVTCSGPEPSISWRGFVAEMVELCRRLGIVRAVSLGGMPAAVSHRRPISVLATATDQDLARHVAPIRPDYRGPTGLQTVLQVALRDAGIPTVGLWAQVPHYVAANLSPPAVLALLARLGDVSGVSVTGSDLDEANEAYVARVEEGLADRPDVVELIEAIEARPRGSTGELLVAEIERFLRDEHERPGP